MAQRAYIEVYGDELVAQELFATGDRASSLRPFWPTVQERMHEIEREQFDTAGARSGNAWAPLAQSTLWRKFQRGENLAIMRATDELYDSLTGLTSQSVRTYGDDFFIFGSTSEHFAFHQDRGPDASYPERKPVDFSHEDETEFAQMMLDYVMGVIDRRGRVLPKRGAGGRFVS